MHESRPKKLWFNQFGALKFSIIPPKVQKSLRANASHSQAWSLKASCLSYPSVMSSDSSQSGLWKQPGNLSDGWISIGLVTWIGSITAFILKLICYYSITSPIMTNFMTIIESQNYLQHIFRNCSQWSDQHNSFSSISVASEK